MLKVPGFLNLKRAFFLLASLIVSVSGVFFFFCADEELSSLKGIEGETAEDKPPQQVVLPIYLLCM